MTTESENIRRAIEAARQSGDDQAVSSLESYFSQLSGPSLSREHRLDKIAALDQEIEGMTLAKDRNNVGSYWGGLGRTAQPEPERPALEDRDPMENREVAQPLIDPFSRTGQTLTSFEVGIKRQIGDYFKRKDDAVHARDSLYDHVYNRLSPAEQERMKAPRHWGWQYDSYKNMPFLDFRAALQKGGEWNDENWKRLVGEERFNEMLSGDHPMVSEAGGFYRFFVQPWLSDGEVKPSERLYQSVEGARSNWYTEETKKSLEKPFVAKDAELLKPWSWFDETTKAPWEDWDGFYYSVAENTPQITMGIVSARAGGRAGSRLAALSKADKAEDLIKLQRRLATAGGIVAGAGSEALMIHDNVYAETSKRVEQLPDEKWQENPEYQQLVASGYSDEMAKQTIGFEVGTKAANTAMVVAGLLMGSPMSAFFGRMGAGRLGGPGRSFFGNMFRGTTGESLQEGSQEAMEQFLGNLNVSYVDPTQSLTEGLGESFAGGALIGAGPGALGSIESSQPAGFTDEQIKAIDAGTAIRRAILDRFNFEQEVTSEEPGREKSPKQRVEEYQKLEQMQRKEAETILENEDTVRDFINSQGGNQTELKMLSRLVAKANMTLADIAAAEARRTTAAQQLMEEQEIQKERVRIEGEVNRNLVKLEDVQRQASAIEAVQNFEAIPEEQYAELRREGYGKWTGPNDEKFVILPKGRRALKELRRQSVNLQQKIEEGYTGPERRQSRNDARRQMIEAASAEQREEMLYHDTLTGVQNRRAFNERSQGAPVVAAVDVDSLKWVNDNMGQHAAGDRLLMNVANALKSQEGVEVYRFDGDEFAVTGPTEEAVESALQAAAKSLQTTPIRNERDEIIPTITWGKGATYEEADLESAKQKRERARSGKRAGRDKPPPSLRNRSQGLLFHRDEEVSKDQAQTLESHFQRPIEEIDVKEAKEYLETINFKKGPTKKLLVIHPADQTTDFLKKIYKDIKKNDIDGVTVVTDNISNEEIRELIKSHDRVMMMGHGTSGGLLSKGRPGGHIIDESMVDLLQKKDDSIFIWCHANKFCSKHNLKGFSTGMFISEPSEAALYRVPHKRAEIDESNEAFADVMSRSVNLSSDEIYNAVKNEYGKLDSNVTAYNIEQMKTPLPDRWRQVSDIVQMGDDIEILTPNGALIGVITNVKGSRKRPRLKVNIQGREFTFNPRRNWLIVNDMTDPADLAWITGNEDYDQEGREVFPQTISTVTIGHIGSDGRWIADLTEDVFEFSSDPYQESWWENDYPEWNENIPWITSRHLAFDEVTEEEMTVALNVVNAKIGDLYNLPPIRLIDSLETLERVAPETVAEARAMGQSFSGVRGFFDETRPDNGIVLIIPNMPGKPGDETFEMAVTETLMHELIGHYGVRGIFGNNNEELRQYMHNVVDQFSEVEKIIRPSVPRRGMTDADYKQMVGEEMIAYIAGEMMAGKFNPNPKQRNFLQRFFEWIRAQMVRLGWLKPHQQTAREKFWNDDRIRDLVARSIDYVRSGKVQTPSAKTMQQTSRYMRDMDIFKSGISLAIQNATRTLTGSQRKQLAPKYGGKQNVPKEVPMFDEVGSPNKYMDVIKKLKADNKITAKELELTKLDPDGDWNFLRDTTYQELQQYLPEEQQDAGGDWWSQIMPPNLAREMNEALKTAKAKFVAPVVAGQGANVPKQLSEAATKKKLDAEKRVDEILSMKLDPKRSQLTKDILLNYLDKSDKVVRIYVDDVLGRPELSYERAAQILFGTAALEDGFLDRLTESEKKMIWDEIKHSRARGINIGFNERTQRWVDRTVRPVEFADYSPQGSDVSGGNYRVTYLIQEGGGLPVGKHAHFDNRPGVITHVRTALGTLTEVEGALPIPAAPNPAMQGKSLVMVELQSDWLQRSRKGFTSEDERTRNDVAYRNSSNALKRIVQQFGENVVATVQLRLKELVKPVANLPDGSLRSSLEARIEEEYPGGATQDQREAVYRSVRRERLEEIAVNVMAASNRAFEFRSESTDEHDIRLLQSSLDIRTFDRLDRTTASAFASHIASDLKRLAERISNLALSDNQQSAFVEDLNFAIEESMQRFLGSTKDDTLAYVFRLPLATRYINSFLVPAFSEIGVSEEAVKKITEAAEQINTVSFRLPVIPFNTLMRESGQYVDIGSADTIKQIILSSDRLGQHGIVSNNIDINVTTVSSGEFDITVSGHTDSLEKFREALPSMINEWATEALPRVWEKMFQTPTTEIKQETTDGDFSYSWDELESEFNFEEIDVSGDQDGDLDRYGVQAFYRWEEDRIGEFEEEAVNAALNNIDWDDVTNEHGESLSRTGSDYRELLEIDEDGDVDNSEAERWITNARDLYRSELYQDQDVQMSASEAAREAFDEDPPMLWLGRLPIEWDENGDVTDDVEIAVVQEGHGEYAKVYINNEDIVGDYADKDDAFSAVNEAVSAYYSDNDINPPAGNKFSRQIEVSRAELEKAGQGRLELSEADEGPVMPNFADMANALTSNIQELKEKPKKATEAFNTMVVSRQKMEAGGEIYTDSPFSPDKYWRTAALKYLIADAVRRGISSIVWHPGSASTSRGGWRPDWKSVSRISWNIEEVEVRGETHEALVITAPDYNSPIMLSWDKAAQALGSDVVGHIQRQMRGELPAVPNDEDSQQEREPSKDDYLLSRSDPWVSVHYRYTGELMGFFAGEEAANEFIDREVEEKLETMGRTERERPEVQPGGRVVTSGEVTEKSLGGTINISLPTPPTGYRHTFIGGPRSAAARNSYEIITKKIWEKELQKYDGKISEHWVKVSDLRRAAKHEGMVIKETGERDEQIRQKHGHLEVKELIGEHHGWVIVSERNGILTEQVFSSQRAAQKYLDDFITQNYGNPQGAAKVFYIEVNDKMREEFKGPTTPFHYDPTQDPELKEAAEKIGYEKTSLRERLASMRQNWRDHFNQGMFDKFYGIKRAIHRSGMVLPAETDPYIQTRLTTSLDSVMKAVLEYGHPVWKEGIVQTEGVGLLDILQPVMKDIDLWGMYMAGKRAKGLLMEGFDKMSETHRQKLIEAARHFEGKTDKDRIFNLVAHVSKTSDSPTMSRRDAIKALGLGAIAASTTTLPGDSEIDKTALSTVRRSLKGRARKDAGRRLPPATKFRNPEQAKYSWRKKIMEKTGASEKDADAAIDRAINQVIEEQRVADAARREAERSQSMKRSTPDAQKEIRSTHDIVERLIELGREKNFTPAEIKSMSELDNHYPVFALVGSEYAAFNKKVLDFAEASGIINKETRVLWENADYVPFYRVQDDRLIGPLSGGAGISGQKKPIRRLKGAEAHVGNITHNIFVNLTKLIDSSMKNHAALLAVDSLKEVGIISKKPMNVSQEMIPLNQVKKLLIDRGMNPESIPEEALTGLQKMFAIQPPEGEGVISVLRNGKKEFYFTDDILLYQSLTMINKKAWGSWMNLLRAPKRLLTTLITLDPGFMLANYMRDSLSAFVLSRDTVVPVVGGLKGFGQALVKDESMRTMMSAGASFQNGYINQYDPKATNRLIKRAMKKKSFSRTLLTSPAKLLEAWKAIGSATENANRVAVYEAAIRAGKGKARAVYEAKDLMDFSMGGQWPFVQFLIQTVPFMGARMQGIHRLGRGAIEHPVGFTVKGTLVGLAGLALWFAFKDDDRYKELEEWDKDVYFHWWIGETHYRLPKPFEVGAIFNTIPERTFEYMYSRENDAGKLLMRRYGFMIAETFNMSPIPQTFRPMLESYFNYNWFTGRSIVSPYEENRLPPEQYRYTTSPTMVEIARLLPGQLDTVSTKIRSPLHLQNLYAGYTGTLGRYFLMASDSFLRQQLDYPLPPEKDIAQYPVVGRFFRGESPKRTKYEEEVYRLIDKTIAIQGSLSFLEKTQQEDRLKSVLEEHEPYVRVSDSLESIREDVQDINRSIMQLYMDSEKPPEQKKKEIDLLQEQKNILFKEGFELRPGGTANQPRPLTDRDVIDLIDDFGIDDSPVYLRHLEENAPDTYELLDIIRSNMEKRNILSLAKAGNNGT